MDKVRAEEGDESLFSSIEWRCNYQYLDKKWFWFKVSTSFVAVRRKIMRYEENENVQKKENKLNERQG